MGDTSFHICETQSQKAVTQVLSYGWVFRECDVADEATWLPVKVVPSTVHQDLVDNGKLADPFVGFNESKAEWVGQRSWTYQTTFTLPRPLIGGTGRKAILVFEGLDTFATVTLDGNVILEADNMFLPYHVEITDLVSTTSLGDFESQGAKEHRLEIVFDSALYKAREIEGKYPDHKWICWNGESARLAARKAQYHWGWDWGPFLMTAGIWRDVKLEVYDAKIVDVRVDVRFGAGLGDVLVDVSFTTDGWDDQGQDDIRASLTLRCANSTSLMPVQMKRLFDIGTRTMSLEIDEPELWWPIGYGSQTLYEVEVAIHSSHNIELDSMKKRIGLRKLELVQTPDEHGKSFYFRINDVDIFCGGSCWIPADSFLTNITPEKYRSWIELMVPANQNMIRVWGGGIYESDAFYDACDELGILVWQDFMFGCGNYPAFPSFLNMVKDEATANVRRIRHHPSLAIFAGNNEDYQVQEQSGLTYDYADKDEANWLETDFPARYIYESVLPKVVAAESPSIPYHPGSPWGDGKITSDPTVGDIHQWNVWHGTQEKYQIFDTLGGRFNSEFGMEAFPHIDTIRSFVEKEEDLYQQSHVIDFHNKAAGHERRIATYLVENVRVTTDLKAYIHLTQLIQCEALMYGYRGWRKQWGDNRKCGGALVWQLNDCWPVTSWSICDYYLRPKPAYYAMARVLAPVAVGIRREHYDWSVSHASEPQTLKWELWAVTSALEKIKASVEVRFISVRSGKDIRQALTQSDVILQPNGTTNIAVGIVDNISQEPHILAARLWVDDKIVARDTDWPQPLKYLHFPDRKLKVTFKSNEIRVSAERPVKCLVFEEREGVRLSDSALDVVPGDEQVVTVHGPDLLSEPLGWTYLGADEQ